MEDAVNELQEKYKVRVLAIQADVSDKNDNDSLVKGVVEEVKKAFGRLDVLINKLQQAASLLRTIRPSSSILPCILDYMLHSTT